MFERFYHNFNKKKKQVCAKESLDLLKQKIKDMEEEFDEKTQKYETRKLLFFLLICDENLIENV